MYSFLLICTTFLLPVECAHMNFITFIGDFMKAKKIIIRSLIVVIVIIIGLYIFGVATGNNVPKEEPKQEEKETKEDTQKEEEKDQFNPNDIVVADYADKTTDEYINAFIDGVKPNTSKMVDVINRAARNSANYSASEEKRNEAVNFLRDNYPNYTADDNTMIKVMYYGFYLNHAYGDGTTYGDLGFDASQIAKNVYRGSETTDSDFIKANYEQVEKSLSQIQ